MIVVNEMFTTHERKHTFNLIYSSPSVGGASPTLKGGE